MTMLISSFNMIYHNKINSAKIIIVCFHKCKNKEAYMFLTWTLKQNHITPNSKVYHNVAVIKERQDVDKKDLHIEFKSVISVCQFLSLACFVLQTFRTSKRHAPVSC